MNTETRRRKTNVDQRNRHSASVCMYQNMNINCRSSFEFALNLGPWKLQAGKLFKPKYIQPSAVCTSRDIHLIDISVHRWALFLHYDKILNLSCVLILIFSHEFTFFTLFTWGNTVSYFFTCMHSQFLTDSSIGACYLKFKNKRMVYSRWSMIQKYIIICLWHRKGGCIQVASTHVLPLT